MLNILVTRSKKENIIFAKNFKNTDSKISFFNSFSFKLLNLNFNEFQQFKNVIITSKIAANIITNSICYPINCYVVGKNSAKILQYNKNITISGRYKNIATFKEDFLNLGNKENIIYYSGNFISFDFLGIKRKIIYEIIYNQVIDINFQKKLSEADVFVFYSCNTAKNFLHLLKKGGFLHLLSNKKIVALSNNIASLFTKISCEILYSSDSCNDQMVSIIKWIITNQSNNHFLPKPPFVSFL